MRTVMTLNKPVILQKREDAYGSSIETNIVSSKNAYASVQMPSLRFQAENEAAGRKTDLSVHLWRSVFETDNYTHVVINNTVYRINGIGTSINDLYVKISLERDLA